jgi:hypothetical protein
LVGTVELVLVREIQSLIQLKNKNPTFQKSSKKNIGKNRCFLTFLAVHQRSARDREEKGGGDEKEELAKKEEK